MDDDLLSCFLWAAGENAVAQPGWESPSMIPVSAAARHERRSSTDAPLPLHGAAGGTASSEHVPNTVTGEAARAAAGDAAAALGGDAERELGCQVAARR